MSYVTEFISFPVKTGKEDRADLWLNTLIARQADCIETLDREAMHFESIFRTEINGRLHLSWFSFQGNTGSHVTSSTYEIDKVHIEFWRECIDTSMPPIIQTHVVSFIPKCIASAIAKREEDLATTKA